MARGLPNLDWLRVFAAAAETESFALAASRLGVTPGAVSQRIKALEAFLGVSLFQRHPQGVRLTDTGWRYGQRVAPALEQLAEATHQIRAAQGPKAVRLTILPAAPGLAREVGSGKNGKARWRSAPSSRPPPVSASSCGP